MGKITNALEKVVNAYFYQDVVKCIDEVKNYHQNIMQQLFTANHPVYITVNNLFVEIEWTVEELPRSYSFIYDQIVSIGELVSTAIIRAYLNDIGIKNTWLDARSCIQTDNNYRQGNIDWELTDKLVNEIVASTFKHTKVIVTQGFIGGT